VGLDGYNFGSPWQSPAEVFGASYRTITGFTDKPFMIAEWGCAERGGDKAAWIDQFFRDLPSIFPEVDAVVLFSQVDEDDFRVNSSPAALDAYRRAVRSVSG
jgi:endoglucanase